MPRCIHCGTSFQEDESSYYFLHGRRRKYCSSKCGYKAYVIRKYGGYSGLNKAKFGSWGSPTAPDKSKVLKSEKLAVAHILPKEGFTDIFWYSGLYPNAFTDILARKDGHVCSINVTTFHSKSLNIPATIELTRYLGLERFVLFIKPDFSAYCLRHVKLGQKAVAMHVDATLVPIRTNPTF
ncbi:MAG TPA: hypothetical protein VND41_02170 [Nitrososphaerales archaeon]|nr:hypothetical protein [Nitrososphaerales archaeon]